VVKKVIEGQKISKPEKTYVARIAVESIDCLTNSVKNLEGRILALQKMNEEASLYVNLVDSFSEKDEIVATLECWFFSLTECFWEIQLLKYGHASTTYHLSNVKCHAFERNNKIPEMYRHQNLVPRGKYVSISTYGLQDLESHMIGAVRSFYFLFLLCD